MKERRAEFLHQVGGLDAQRLIFLDESGAYTITDNNSSNGTFVNGAKIKQAILRNDDVIQIGDINLIFQN